MKGFSKLLSETMDEMIREVLGEAACELISRFEKRQVMVKREEAGESIEVFYGFLKRLLGSEGAWVIQASCLRRLCLKLQREYEEIETHFSLLDGLYKVKFRLLASPSEPERNVCN